MSGRAAGQAGRAPGKACPIVLRCDRGRTELLAFEHPLAGKQFVKGGIRPAETPLAAAIRELHEESGLEIAQGWRFVCRADIGAQSAPWHMFAVQCDGLPETWAHQTLDDHGHVFRFFWHPFERAPGSDWHPVFREAWRAFAPICLARLDQTTRG